MTVRRKPFNLFLDDSGTKEYAARYSTSGGVTPYFVFGGLLVSPAIAGAIHHRMLALKLEYFGADKVEIKANWLRRQEQREKRYLRRFGISDERLNEFSDKLYELIADTDCTLFACLVAKDEVQTQYKYPHYAPSIAYDCLLQRIQMQMHDRDGEVHVTIDDMSGATPKRTQYKDNLRSQHKRLKTSGSPLQKGMVFDRIGGLSFSDSKADERLQLADLVAYSVYRQFVDHARDWEEAVGQLPTYEYLGLLTDRFCRSPDGVIAGWGLVKFPTKQKRKWGIGRKNP